MKAQTENPFLLKKLPISWDWVTPGSENVKEYTGVSPNQYLLQQKLLRAKELLTTTQLNVSEIAYQLKFDNTGQFSTFFKSEKELPRPNSENAHISLKTRTL
jgi:methylphosphotriester-DNA--protein-cysteine methyltransferase